MRVSGGSRQGSYEATPLLHSSNGAGLPQAVMVVTLLTWQAGALVVTGVTPCFWPVGLSLVMVVTLSLGSSGKLGLSVAVTGVVSFLSIAGGSGSSRMVTDVTSPLSLAVTDVTSPTSPWHIRLGWQVGDHHVQPGGL